MAFEIINLLTYLLTTTGESSDSVLTCNTGAVMGRARRHGTVSDPFDIIYHFQCLIRMVNYCNVTLVQW